MHLRTTMCDRPPKPAPRDVRLGEAGFLTFSGILMLVVVAAILFAAFKLLPPYIDNYQLQDAMEGIARNATYTKMNESDIRKQVMAQVRDLDIPVEDRDIKIQQNGPSVNISLQYTVPVDLLVRQVDLRFSPSAGNRNIMAK